MPTLLRAGPFRRRRFWEQKPGFKPVDLGRFPCLLQAPDAQQTSHLPAASPQDNHIRRGASNFNLLNNNQHVSRRILERAGLARGRAQKPVLTQIWQSRAFCEHQEPNKHYRHPQQVHTANIFKGQHLILIFERERARFVRTLLPFWAQKCHPSP